MIRLDPLTASPLPANPAPPPTVPAWALAGSGAASDADAAFQAGAEVSAEEQQSHIGWAFRASLRVGL